MGNKRAPLIKSLAKALKLMENIADHGDGVSISELNKKFGFGKSTIHRLLATLKSGGYIRQTKESQYILSYKLFDLTHRFEKNHPLLNLSKIYLKELLKSINETANLAILDQKDVLYVAKEESIHQLRTTYPEGGKAPAHCTALGKAILSGLSDKELNSLYPNNILLNKQTNMSISDPLSLKQEIEEVRREGYAMDNEEAAKGIKCLAVPIRNYTGHVIAAMSISFPTQRANSRIIKKYAKVLKEKGEKFSTDLGYKPLIEKIQSD
jgi:IclR family transcriptional regulator, KDG regulon repressor